MTEFAEWWGAGLDWTPEDEVVVRAAFVAGMRRAEQMAREKREHVSNLCSQQGTDGAGFLGELADAIRAEAEREEAK